MTLWVGVASPISAQAPGLPETGYFNAIAAVVNDSVITRDEAFGYSRTAMQMAARRARTQEQYASEAMRVAQAGLEELIDRRLIVDEFKTAGFAFPESYVDDMVKRRVRAEFGGDRLILMRELRATGQTFESFRRGEMEAIIVTQMRLKNIKQHITISPKRIERFYEQNQDEYRVGDRVRIRMITLSMDRHTRGEAEDLAAEALAKIRAGADFAEVANEYSDDARRFRGGDRGWFDSRDSDLRQELKEAAFSLPAGTVSDVIDVGGALFIMKVQEKDVAKVRPLNEVRNAIEAELRTREEQRLEKAWVERLRRNSFIRYY